MSSAAGPSLDVKLPADLVMRATVRRGAACAMVGLTLHTVWFTLLGPGMSLFGQPDPVATWQAASFLLTLITVPLVVAAGFFLRAYPRNRGLHALIVLPLASAVLSALRVLGFVTPTLWTALVGSAATLALLVGADRVLFDGAGDPDAPKSRIAVGAMALVVVRALLWWGPLQNAGLSMTVLPLVALALTVVELVVFWRVRKILL